MKKIITTVLVLFVAIGIQAAKPRTSLIVYNTHKQTVTGFGGACCDGAMKPFGDDNACVGRLFGPRAENWTKHITHGNLAKFHWR